MEIRDILNQLKTSLSDQTSLLEQPVRHFPISFSLIFLLVLVVLVPLSSQSNTEEARSYFLKTWQALDRKEFNKAILLADTTRSLYKEAGDNYGEGLYHFLKGGIARNQGNAAEADSLFNIYLDYGIDKGDTSMLGSVYYQLGLTSEALGNLQKAIEMQYESIRHYLMRRDSLGINHNLNNLGSIYRKLKQYDLAEEHFLKALSINKKIKSFGGQADNLGNLGNLYAEKKEFDKALDFYQQAVYFDSITNFQWGLGYDYENIGNMYMSLGRYDLAYQPLIDALKIREELGQKYELAQSCLKLGEWHLSNNQNSKAISYLQKAEEYAIEIGVLESKRDILKARSQVYENLGFYRQAHESYKQYNVLADSIINQNTTEKIASLNVQFETERKEQQIQLLHAENELADSKIASSQKQIYGLLTGLIIFAGLLFIVFRLYRKMNTQNTVISRALSEKEVLLREIHHRVKNNLQFISSLLRLQTEHIDDQKALGALQEGQDRVHSMALIHQNLYQEDNLTGVNIKDYFVKLVSNLFDSYNIRNDQIELELNIEELNLDVDSVIPIGLIVNELVSNSLKYAFPGDRKGTISVGLKEVEKQLHVFVYDNGIGIEHEKKDLLGSSFGYRLIEVFKEQLEAELHIESNEGTAVTMILSEYEKV